MGFNSEFKGLNSFGHVHSDIRKTYICLETNRKVAGSTPDGVIGIFH